MRVLADSANKHTKPKKDKININKVGRDSVRVVESERERFSASKNVCAGDASEEEK